MRPADAYALLGQWRRWQRSPALCDASPMGMPVYPAEASAALWLERRGLAVLVSADGRAYLQPATT